MEGSERLFFQKSAKDIEEGRFEQDFTKLRAELLKLQEQFSGAPIEMPAIGHDDGEAIDPGFFKQTPGSKFNDCGFSRSSAEVLHAKKFHEVISAFCNKHKLQVPQFTTAENALDDIRKQRKY